MEHHRDIHLGVRESRCERRAILVVKNAQSGCVRERFSHFCGRIGWENADYD